MVNGSSTVSPFETNFLSLQKGTLSENFAGLVPKSMPEDWI